MALINPCNLAVVSRNTGSECSDALVATALLILMPKGTIIPGSSLSNFTAYAEAKCAADKNIRWYPIGGTAAPIRTITDKNGNDIIETLEDGSDHFIRYDMYNRTFVMTDGGLCFAQALQSFNGNAYGFIEVDQQGKIAMMNNGDGTYSPFPVNIAYAPTPDLGNFKTTYKNKWMMSFSPIYYITKGKIFASDVAEDLLNLSGLIDTVVSPAIGATQSTTHVFVNVATDCAETDLVALYPGSGSSGDMAQITNFVVTLSVSPFTVVTPSAVAYIPASGSTPAQVNLTGTFVSGSSYNVALAEAATLEANGINGYEGIKPALVTIP